MMLQNTSPGESYIRNHPPLHQFKQANKEIITYSEIQKEEAAAAAAAAAEKYIFEIYIYISMEELKLHGIWASPYSRRIQWALNLKGVPYEYIEEDPQNKSKELLRFNPVQKKVPVLVHRGKPILESLIILEYIDQIWKDDGAPLLPKDSYRRSKARFWAHFVDNSITLQVMRTAGEEQEAARDELVEKLRVLEKGLEEDYFSGGSPFLHGEQPGYLDIVIGTRLVDYLAFEEAIGLEIFDPEKHPLLFKWLTKMKELEVVKETTPDHERMVAFFRRLREMALNPSKQ
ncbi:hypothetical protein H6P81_011275 [Aristolochia fimbriata]|uniref:glutathione transferase n=1 Tax=Aristolochia fimbriata TaxID=158543 RepID=A0AAV7ER13_ARIFI|nr:hypothetical protein H6P81_011275 [Aristolochia fimbriata]